MDKFWRILTRRQTTVGSAAFVLVLMVFVSRVLGLFRDRLLSGYFVPDELGVYFAAFRLPNLLFELLVMGAITSAFIPVFTKYVTYERQEVAWRLASTLINLSAVVLVAVSLPILVWTEAFSRLLAPGFSADQVRLMASFTRFMIIFQVFPLLIGNFFTGILQSYNLFLVPATAPVLYNLGIIVGIAAFSPILGLWAPVVGVAIGAFLFVAIQLPLLARVGYRHSLVANPKQAGVAEVARLMGPRTVGLAASQIDATVDLVLASLLGARMVTIFNFAQHLQQLPVGLFGMTIAQAALPQLAKMSARADREEFRQTIISAVHQILFFVLPISVLFAVLRIPVVRLVFGADRFDWEATVLTGMTLSAFSVSLFAQAITHVLARGFYALYDTKTPVSVGVVSVILNAGLSAYFVLAARLPVWSLGLSTSIASIANGALLLFFLDRRVGRFSRVKLIVPVAKMAVAALATGMALYVPLKLLDQLVFDTTRTFGLLMLTGVSGGIGLATYFFLSWVLGIEEVDSIFRLIKRLKRLRGIFFEPASEVVNGSVQDKTIS